MASELETPIYEVLEKSGSFEIRNYDPMIIAVTKVNSRFRKDI